MRYKARLSNWRVGAIVEDTRIEESICSCDSDSRACQIADALNKVERLTLSEDGVRIAPGDTVYQIDPKGMINRPPNMFGADPNPRPWNTILTGVFFVPGLPFFSTGEAALNSLKDGSPH